MKIVLAVHQFLPEFSAGTEILTYETAKELKKRGHDVSVVTGFPALAPLDDEKRFDHYVVSDIPVRRFMHTPEPMGSQSIVQELEYNNLLVGAWFKEYLTGEKPDLVHFYNLARLSASLVDVCSELGIPTVLTPTDFWFICPTGQLRLPDNRPCSGPDRLSLNCLHHVLSISQLPGSQSRFLKFPKWILALIVVMAKYGGRLGRLYKPWVQAFVQRSGFLRKRMNKVSKVALPTQLMGAMLIKNGLDPKRTFSLPFGLNPEYSEVQKIAMTDVLRLGYIGTLAEYKGVHVLLQAVKHLSGKPIHLKIYGKSDDYPEYFASLQRMAAGDARIEFCGTFPNSQIGRIFADLDALVVPSLWYENSPLVIYSAQRSQCPVVASDMAGMSEVIEHGTNGLLFKVGDSLSLAGAIESLLDDRMLLQLLSKNSRSPLTIQEYVDRLVDAYSGLVPVVENP